MCLYLNLYNLNYPYFNERFYCLIIIQKIMLLKIMNYQRYLYFFYFLKNNIEFIYKLTNSFEDIYQ